MTYRDAGVDIDAGAELVRRIRKMAPWIGGFGDLLPYSMILSSLLTASLNS
jgi:phosphoribosylformylglycinamidine cyclo-ligase